MAAPFSTRVLDLAFIGLCQLWWYLSILNFFLCHCFAALREDWYYIAGKAIAVSLVHGGPPPNFLAPTIFCLLVNGSANPKLEDIADTELLEKVKKVS